MHDFNRFVYESSSARFTYLDDQQNERLINGASKGRGCKMCSVRKKRSMEKKAILQEEMEEGAEEPTRTVLYKGKRFVTITLLLNFSKQFS